MTFAQKAARMLLFLLRLIYLAVCAGAIATYVSDAPTNLPKIVGKWPFLTFCLMLAVTQLVTLADVLIRRKRIEYISAVYFGLLIGILLSYLLIQALSPVLSDLDYAGAIVLLILLVLPYLCISLILQTKDDFRFIIPYVEFARELKGGKPLILDSSALIDGRIADVINTRIIDSELVVPNFILLEIQDIADSHDKMRRTRGRRGLEVLSKLRGSPLTEVRVYEETDDIAPDKPVDARLVELAKKLNGRVLTSDFNLNKVASVQGIDVINLNDVANSLKPRHVPGDRLQVKIIREGESPGQGVGYLDDGTMVVIEQAAHYIGRQLDIIVTSVLQSSAGRMIFGRQVHSVQRDDDHSSPNREEDAKS